MGGVAAAPANAADLGGDCCADLEERVSELEATTVRKGNRKVSVTLYGWVNAGVLWYDDGEESDAYVVDTDTAVSRIGVRGQGTLRPGVDAGYRIELATPGAAELSFLSSNDNDDGTGGVRVRHAYWWISSEHMGKLTVGQTDTASGGVIDGVDLSGPGGWISYNGHGDWVFSFGVVGAPGDLWGFMSAFDAGRQNVVRYDTPTMAGFTASASWSEDDQYDVALTYSNNWNGLEVAAAIGYYWSNDEYCEFHPNCGAQDGIEGDHDVWGGSISAYHAASGLFGTFSYAKAQGDLDTNDRFPGSTETTDADQWYAKIGMRKNWFGHGETAIYVEYGETNVDTDFGAGLSIFGGHGNFALGGTLAATTTEAEGTMWGIGIGQDFDSMGATAYLGYRHHEADITDGIAGELETEDMDAVLAGMVVPF
jgi:predicted porin